MTAQSYRPPAQYVPSYAEQLITQYNNCRDSLRTFQAQSETKGSRGTEYSEFSAEVALDRFSGNVDIMEKMITERFKTDSYRKNLEDARTKAKPSMDTEDYFQFSLSRFGAITELFEEKHLWRERPVPGNT